MNGKVFIDNTDIYSTYSAFVIEGGYNGLLGWPSVKDVDYNNWAEEDGVELDLSALYFEAKAFAISFVLRDSSKVEAFTQKLYSAQTHSWRFADIGITRTLRTVRVSGLDYDPRKLTFIRVDFCEDQPAYTYQTPAATYGGSTNATLDGKAFSTYGVTILEGGWDMIRKAGAIKKALGRSLKGHTGVIYDDAAPVRREARAVTLNCLLRAKTAAEAMKNYYALLKAFTQAKTSNPLMERAKRVLTVDDFTLDCHYLSNRVIEFHPDEGKIWLVFSVDLAVIA